MSDWVILTLTIGSIICMILLCSFIITQADKENVQPIRALWSMFIHKDDTLYQRLKIYRKTTVGLMLVPVIMMLIMFYIAQISEGRLHFRKDIQTLGGCVFWIGLCIYVKIKNRTNGS